ncbi:MAG TPA: nucleotide pyrophosphohydrolase [Candidatus Dormibacteraeota bacterium]|nr:nucleotide pyrophosphohydrolase [Candidatus Dormibacteraeota bacterium]
MSLVDYQEQVDAWAQSLQVPYWSPLSQLARLTEEVGELARVYNHKYGQKIKKPTESEDDLEGELGDILFDVICMANTENIDLDKALQRVILKSKTRDKDRFAKKIA